MYSRRNLQTWGVFQNYRFNLRALNIIGLKIQCIFLWNNNTSIGYHHVNRLPYMSTDIFFCRSYTSNKLFNEKFDMVYR